MGSFLPGFSKNATQGREKNFSKIFKCLTITTENKETGETTTKEANKEVDE
jgi:hypothetical protein